MLVNVAQVWIDGSTFNKIFVGTDLDVLREKAREYLRGIFDIDEDVDPLNANVLGRIGAGFSMAYGVEVLGNNKPEIGPDSIPGTSEMEVCDE